MKPNMRLREPFSSPVILVFVLGLLFCVAACEKPAADGRTFTDAAKGFSITRPEGWRFGTREEIEVMRAGATFEDKDFQAQVRERAVLPFVVVMRHETGYEGLNPSVQVIVRPVGDLEKFPVLFILNMLLPSFEKALPNFELVESPRLEKVGGLEAAFAKSQYDYTTEGGRTFPVLNRTWYIRRGQDLFMISMTDAGEGPDAAEAEFAEILKSIKIKG